ncbi:MAG: murein transglycosylase A [Lautropia sp.]
MTHIGDVLARYAALCLLVLAGCTSVERAPPAPSRAPVPLAQLAGFADDDLAGVATALGQQCAMRTPPPGWGQTCADLAENGADLRRWLGERFVAVPLLDDANPQGLVTGYFEPLISASLARESAAQVPIYGTPPDLLVVDLAEVAPQLKGLRLRGRLEGRRVVPYPDRARAGRSALPAPVLAWADDPVELFFVEIQGSGRVRLRDGSLLRIGYADQNGHPYRAIGRTLIERGAMRREDVTAPAIKAWLKANPGEAAAVMNGNPSQVFFRELPAPPRADLGPPGSLGVALTPLRSIAVDRAQIPLGSLVWLDTTDPLTGAPLRRLMVAQDTGGAIRGRQRADVFWGFGATAEQAAGAMKAPGRFWVLTPRAGGDAPPAAASAAR